jgi:hypothetical protein
VNWRAIGCIGLGSIAFVLIGILGLNVASSRIGCPDRLQWRDLSYTPTGTPAPSPQTGGSGAPAKLGSTFIGLTTRDIYGPPGSSASTSSADRPTVIAMDCGDGTYLTYRQAGAVPTLRPSPTSPGD